MNPFPESSNTSIPRALNDSFVCDERTMPLGGGVGFIAVASDELGDALVVFDS
jgi:hypothetical protein